MKKLAILLPLLIFSFSACTFQQEIEDLYNRVEEIKKTEAEIKKQIQNINDDIRRVNKLITAIQAGVYVKSCVPFADEKGEELGYILTLSNETTITIYHGHNGEDGIRPNVGAKRGEDGYYYWTLDGEFVLVNGVKVRADGGVPMFEIRDGWWYVSYDSGETWHEAGRATGEDGQDGAPGDSLFDSIEYEAGNSVVVFHLADGTEIMVPCYQAISIEFDVQDNLTAISAGETIKVNYSLSFGNEQTIVTASSDGNYKVKVEQLSNTSGAIYITCPGLYVDGHINVMAFDGVGYSAISIITFYEKQIIISGSKEFHISADGGDINIPVSYNVAYYVEVPKEYEEWLVAEKTKAEFVDGKITIHVAENKDEARSGKVYIYTSNATDIAYAEIKISQDAAYFNISRNSFIFQAVGGTQTADVHSSGGLSAKSSVNWLKTEIKTVSKNNYTLYVTANQNTGGIRTGKIYLYDSEGKRILTDMDVAQLAPQTGGSGGGGGGYEPLATDMVFRVRAKIANDYTVYLPITRDYGNVDCIIDWGDGNQEVVNGGSGVVYHRYDGITEAGKDFDVAISGTVSILNSGNIPEGYRSGIIAVKQWGNTGLESMSNAFLSNTSLESLAGDNLLAFSNVDNFGSAFKGCPNLKHIDKDLFRYASKAYYFSSIFSDCHSLEEIPAGLFSNCGKAKYMEYCFSHCTSLKSVPSKLFANCVYLEYITGAFCECNGLETVEGDIFENCKAVMYASGLFQYCHKLKSIPANLFKFFVNVRELQSAFCNCNEISAIPSGLFSECESLRNLEGAFVDCNNLTSIPKGLFDACTEVYNFSRTFGWCYNLTSIPTSLFDNQRKVTNFEYTFADCRKVQNESPYTTVLGKKVHLYERKDYPDYFVTPNNTYGCFGNGTKLSDYDKIPESWKY